MAVVEITGILIIGTIILISILFFGMLYYAIKKAVKNGIKEAENK